MYSNPLKCPKVSQLFRVHNVWEHSSICIDISLAFMSIKAIMQFLAPKMLQFGMPPLRGLKTVSTPLVPAIATEASEHDTLRTMRA